MTVTSTVAMHGGSPGEAGGGRSGRAQGSRGLPARHAGDLSAMSPTIAGFESGKPAFAAGSSGFSEPEVEEPLRIGRIGL